MQVELIKARNVTLISILYPLPKPPTTLRTNKVPFFKYVLICFQVCINMLFTLLNPADKLLFLDWQAVYLANYGIIPSIINIGIEINLHGL